ncbi:MAG: PD-(D/E)XK nuclease family protein [Candidatus Omnitrophica bacterium]|nr:PD-(D/E)XK nuclease family protein [Candidatus Omnitrophota bacterium]
MKNVITYDLSDRFIDKLADEIVAAYAPAAWPRLAFVFGGRRPQLFFQKALAERVGRASFSPRFFTIDEFMEYLASRQGEGFSRLNDLEACFEIYRTAQKKSPSILEGRSEFWRFLPWAEEVLGFFEQLDLEDIQNPSLKDVAAHAGIGYDVPESINTLLGQLYLLREDFHRKMEEAHAYSRGFIYLLAARKAAEARLDDFERIFFCNFFYLHRTEETVMRTLHAQGRSTMVFQGRAGEWSVLERLSSVFGVPIEPPAAPVRKPEVRISCGFDLHSQIGMARQALKECGDYRNALVVLPEPATLVPLLSEIASFVGDFNVSMGYPVSRSSLYFLFDLLFRAQETRKADSYYVKDYLGVLSHPLVKNLQWGIEASAMRVLVHKVEEILAGTIQTPLGGSLFIDPKDLLKEDELYASAAAMLERMETGTKKADLKKAFGGLHRLLFERWQQVATFADFAAVLEDFLDALLEKSPLEKYPLNLKIVEQLHVMCRQMAGATFCRERFPQEEILRIFKTRLQEQMVSFSGSPLKGLQILGLFETRSLGFDDVFILDANESVLPKLKVYEPLIPRDVMTQLGLNRLEKEEEIQRYQFMRLVASARRAHIFYQERDTCEKSRFVEALVWEKEKEQQDIGALRPSAGAFRIGVTPLEAGARKQKAHIDFLKETCFSASSVNTYMNCPLRFYYQYVLGLQETEGVSDELEASEIGIFLHSFLERVFKPFVGRKPVVNSAFRKIFFEELDKSFEAELRKRMRSDAFLVREVLRFRMEQFIENEAQRGVREIVALEKEVVDDVRMGGRDFRFKARIDRVDRLDDSSLLVVDYKTGSVDQMPADPGKLEGLVFERKVLRKSVKSFQLPIYFYLVQKTTGAELLNAGLYHLRDALKDGGIKTLFDEAEVMSDRVRGVSFYMKALEVLMQELFDPAVDFEADPSDAPYCRLCPFSYLCR